MRDRRYLSVIAWPPNMDRQALATLLAGPTGLDAPTVKLRLGAAPPTIVGPLGGPAAAAGVRAIRAAGGEAFAPTLADLEALGPSRAVKDLEVADGRVIMELWRGPGEIIDCADIEILVRGRVGRAVQEKPASTAPAPIGMWAGTGMTSFPHAHGIALGFAAAYAANAVSEAGAGPGPAPSEHSDKLDLHTRDRRVFQIDGDKFGYRMLGNLRGHSDLENMDAMCELLSHVAPDEIVDPYFALWRPPAGIDSIRLPMMQVNRESPAFAFYSRWAALMYRHILTG